MTRCIIILKDVDGSPFSGIPLDEGQGAIGTKGFDGLWFSVKIIVTNLTLKNAVRVFLNEINLTVVVAIAFDQDKLVVFDRFNHIGLPIAIGVDSNLVLVRTNPADPLVGPPALIPMRNNQPWIAAARGCREGQNDNQGQRLAHDFVYLPRDWQASLRFTAGHLGQRFPAVQGQCKHDFRFGSVGPASRLLGSSALQLRPQSIVSLRASWTVNKRLTHFATSCAFTHMEDSRPLRVARLPIVGTVIIENQVQLQLALHRGVDGFKKAAKLARPVTPVHSAIQSCGLGYWIKDLFEFMLSNAVSGRTQGEIECSREHVVVVAA